MTTGRKKRDLVVTRIFDSPVERVWKGLERSGASDALVGASGLYAPVAMMDFREGGKSLVCYRTKRLS